jgi:hypothetical protein
MRHVTSSLSRALAVAALAAAAPAIAHAQLPFDGKSGWQVAPTAQAWNFTCCSNDTTTSSLQKASQLTLPLSGAFAIGRHFLLDAYVAYVMGSTTTRDSGNVPSRTASVNGFTDMTVRGSFRLHGDDMMITLGVNLPTGLTNLDSTQFAAQEVLGAPVLQAMSPVLGSGFSGTLGLVGAKRIGSWSWGAGASYQYRVEYSPMQAAALGLGTSVTNVKLAPGSAIRASIGADGLVGSGAMAFSAAVTIYTQDELTRTLPGDTLLQTQVTLGPMIQGEWRWRTSTEAFRQLSVYAYDRYVSRYKSAGKTVPGTNGNFLYGGITGMSPFSPNWGLVTQLHGRWLTGLSIDNTLATAATVTGGAGIGLYWVAGSFTLTPMLGAEYGQIDSGLQSFHTTELQFSFTVAQR